MTETVSAEGESTTSRSRVLVVAAVIERDGRILLTRRPEGVHLAGRWEFPGGKLKPGESPEAALVRECEEEIALAVEVIDILDVTFHVYADRDVLILFYRCRAPQGDVAHREVADHAWVTPQQLDDYELPPADVSVVRKLQASAP